MNDIDNIGGLKALRSQVDLLMAQHAGALPAELLQVVIELRRILDRVERSLALAKPFISTGEDWRAEK